MAPENNTQNMEPSPSKCFEGNSFFKILTEIALQLLWKSSLLQDLYIASLNFPTDFISFRIWYM